MTENTSHSFTEAAEYSVETNKSNSMTTSLYKEEKMTLQQYQQEAARTFLSTGDKDKDILHCLVGLQTEIGELADPFKKGIYYGKEVDLVNVGEEIADSLWYIVNLCRLTGINLDQQLKNNIQKLKVRFPDKFTSENAINRNLELERKELEK